jgi:F-type H+-transporting ATPase subunit b
MHLNGWTLLLQTVNFAVLVWLLRRFLYAPVQRLIDERQAEIRRQQEQIQRLRGDALARLASLDAQRSAIAQERAAALKAADVEAQRAAEQRHAEAERQAQALLAEGRATLAAERSRALEQARELSLDLGADVALRLVEQLPLQLREQAALDRVTEYLGALPDEERAALERQLAQGAILRVITAAALSTEVAARWRERLQSLVGAGAQVSFEVDERLLAGTELRFPQARLQFSWQSVLAALRTQLDSHAHAR